MRLVLDTNVLVAGLLNPFGPPGRLLDGLIRGDWTLVYDDRILWEYRDVLRRPKFNFPSSLVESLLTYLVYQGHPVQARPWPSTLPQPPDPTDAPFVEVAWTVNAPLVTGNRRHYRFAESYVRVLSPRAFLEIATSNPQGDVS